MKIELLRQTGSTDDTKTYAKVRDIYTIGDITNTVLQDRNGISGKNTVLTMTTAKEIDTGLVARIGANKYKISPNATGMAGMKRYNMEILND